MTIDTEHFRARLLKERERVQNAVTHLNNDHPGRLDADGDETPGPYVDHIADVATETLDREMDYSLAENSEQVLREIDAALQRIEDGTYGKCGVCGKEIGVERLEAYPWASLCIDDARKQEGR
jgi:RNA polymerase-binding protein DksA